MRPLQRAIDEDMSSSTVLFGMFAAFAVIALVLAGSGLYAVVSYAANQRVQEFGVRIALGAVPRDIQWMMLRQMGLLVGMGLVIGLAAAASWRSWRRRFCITCRRSIRRSTCSRQRSSRTIALAASYGPVRRACRIDPVRALRLE